MAIVDVYNIENYTGSTSSGAWLTALITATASVTSIALGFFLKYYFDKKDEKSKRQHTGETFENELVAYDIPLRRQVLEIEKYLQQLTQPGFYSLYFTLDHLFDTFKTLDQVEVIKYFKSRKKADAQKYVNTIFPRIAILEENAKRMERDINRYSDAINPQLEKYLTLLNELQTTAYKYRKSLSRENTEKELGLPQYDALIAKYFNSDQSLSPTDVIALRKTFHEDLRKPIFTNPLPFYIYIQDYNLAATNVINRMGNELKKERFMMDTHIRTIRNCYKKIYGKELTTAGVTTDS